MKSEAIVDRINDFVKCLPQKSYDRPAKKFIRDFIGGMLIAQSIDEDGSILPMGKRRQLNRKNLTFSASVERQSRANDKKRRTMHLRYDFEKVTVANLKKTPHETYLVTAWSENSKRPIELLTSIPVTNHEEALQIIVNYLSRWSVEECYRFLKAGAGLEEMRLFSFDKLKNLVRGCFLLASIIARMCRYSSWQKLFSRTALRLKKASRELYNWMYRAADACSMLLQNNLSKLK